MKTRTWIPAIAAGVAVAAWLVATSQATDVGVAGSRVAVRTSTSGRQSLKSIQKDVDIHFGAAPTPAQLSGSLEVYYVDAPENGGLLPLPAPWASATPAVARFKNGLAPAGATPVRVALVKNGKLAKVVARGLGGLDISTPPGAGGVITVLTVVNAADSTTHRMCSRYAVGSGSQVAHGATASGFKLTLKRGVPTPCPDCTDGARNGTETDVDCGGSACPACGPGSACGAFSDCTTQVCVCLLYTSPIPRDLSTSRMPSSA